MQVVIAVVFLVAGRVSFPMHLVVQPAFVRSTCVYLFNLLLFAQLALIRSIRI
jgi:hypothetical protein